MKKVTKIVTLAAAAMCAFAVVGGSFAVAKANQKAYAAVNATYTITYSADSAITVKGPEVAKVGSKVTVELTYNHRLYEVLRVRVGDEAAAEVNDNGKTFYFVMPDGDVNVVVESRYLGEPDDVFDITNRNADKGLYLDGCPANAKAGDIVSFSLSMAADSPYRFGGRLELYTNDANQDDVDYDYDGFYYTFEMPAAPVLVFTLMEAKSYFLNFDQPDLVTSVTFKDNTSFVDSERRAYDNGGDGYFIPYDSDVTVEFRDSAKALVKGVKLNEQEVTFENSLKVAFKMPGKDLDLEVVTAPFYRPLAVDTIGIVAELTGWDGQPTNNYDFVFRRSSTSNGEYVEYDPATTMYGDYVRIYDTPKAGLEDHKITDLDVYYYDADGNLHSGGYLNDVTLTENTDSFGHYHQFTVSTSHYGYLVFVYAESYPQFVGYEFLGDYRGYNIYSSGQSNPTSSYSYYAGSINEYGVFKHGSSTTVQLKKNGNTSPATGNGTVIVGTSTGLGYYGGGWFIRSYSANTGAQNSGDLYVYFKTSNTSMRYRYHLNRASFCAVEAYVGSEVIGRCFYTLANGSGIRAFWSGVEFEFDNGTQVNNSSSYKVKVSGTVVGSVFGSGGTGTFTAAY